MNTQQLQEEIEKEYISATVWGKDGFQIQLSNLLREALTKAYELGREENKSPMGVSQMKLKQLINQNLADIADVVNEGKPTDIRNLVEAQTRIAYEAGRKEIMEKIKIHNLILKSYLAEVLDRNGLHYCKNCGLSEEDLITPGNINKELSTNSPSIVEEK